MKCNREQFRTMQYRYSTIPGLIPQGHQQDWQGRQEAQMSGLGGKSQEEVQEQGKEKQEENEYELEFSPGPAELEKKPGGREVGPGRENSG